MKQECLLIQIDHFNFDNPALSEIISKTVRFHLDDLANKHYDKIARALDIEPEGVEALNPGFDVTPAKYVSAIITEAGISRPPFTNSLEQAVRSA